MDPFDCNGKNPYHIEEVLENKVWRVTYDIENFGITHVEDRKGGEVIYEEKIGSEAYNNKILASAQKYGAEAVAIAKKDIEKMTSWHARSSFPKEQLFDIIEPWFMNMTIVRLNSGGLLLYAPVNVHTDAEDLILSWLKSLGSVEYLIVASSAHTLFLPYAIKAFPQAKIAGPKAAEEKIRFINVVEKFDFITDDKDNLKELNLVLDKEGVEIFELEGDAACNAVMCLVDKKGHNHLFL